jgi:hypothetical protein
MSRSLPAKPTRKVLFVPSRYLTKDKPFRGTFFRGQALLTAEEFDVRVLIVWRQGWLAAEIYLSSQLATRSGIRAARQLFLTLPAGGGRQ